MQEISKIVVSGSSAATETYQLDSRESEHRATHAIKPRNRFLEATNNVADYKAFTGESALGATAPTQKISMPFCILSIGQNTGTLRAELCNKRHTRTIRGQSLFIADAARQAKAGNNRINRV